MSVQNKPDYKIFAGSAKPGEVVTFPDILRGWGVTLDTTGGIPPMEFFNSFGKRLNEWLMYLTQRGVPEWDSSVDYPKSAMTMLGDVFYVSLKQTKNDNPSTTQQSWKKFTDFFGIDGKMSKDQNGADINDKEAFINNLGLSDKYFKLTGGTVSGEVKTEKRFIVENSNGFSGIELIGLAGTVVIETDAAGSGYIVIRDKDGKNIGSVTLSTLMDVNSFIYPGKIEWCSLPLSEMRPHCYHANGDKYPVTTEVGKALKALSSAYKTAHGIVESGGMINVPNVYHSDGRGYFFRANTLGLKQEDVSRRIQGSIHQLSDQTTASGVFKATTVDIYGGLYTTNVQKEKNIEFDTAFVTPTGDENRPISYGLIPIIYLGV